MCVCMNVCVCVYLFFFKTKTQVCQLHAMAFFVTDTKMQHYPGIIKAVLDNFSMS